MATLLVVVAVVAALVVAVLLKATFVPPWRKFAVEARSQAADTYAPFGRAVFFFRTNVDGSVESAHAEFGLKGMYWAWASESSKIEWKPDELKPPLKGKSLKWVM